MEPKDSLVDGRLATKSLPLKTITANEVTVNRLSVKSLAVRVLKQPVQIMPFTAKTLKTVKKTKPIEQGSKGSNMFKAVLLMILFWAVIIMLYSPVLATEVAGMAATFHILAYVLLAVIVWLTIYYLFKVFGKKAVKE